LGKPDCPICGGLGYFRYDVPLDHPEFGRLHPCPCRADELVAQHQEELRRLSRWELLERFTFETFHPEGRGLPSDARRESLRLAYELARDFAARPQGWLLFYGGYGCGKTHLAAAIANALLQQGREVMFVTVPDLLDHLRAAYAPDSPTSYDERFERVRNVEVLILDDLGTESATPWALEKLFQLLNHRYLAQAPTVITTNRDLDVLDPRLRSRLTDVSLVQTVHILAPDYRQAGVDNNRQGLDARHLYSRLTFDTFDLRELELPQEQVENLRRALALAQAYAATPEGWLTFLGGHGCGKTHLAAAIANAWDQRGLPVLFIFVPDLLDHLRAAFNPQSPVAYDRRFMEVRNAPYLVLDDLGAESSTPWAQEKLYQLLNYRYVAQLPTVLTTSLSLDQLDPRLSARLADVRHSTVFAIEAPAYRGGAVTRRRRAASKRQVGG